jgi:hypothetical protein
MKKGHPKKTNLLSRVAFCVFVFIAIVVEGRRRPVICTNKWYQSQVDGEGMAGSPVRSVTPVRQRSPRHCSPSGTTGRHERSLWRHGEIVVERERVVERAATVGNFPVLMKVNYPDWSVLMRVMLQARGLWLTVSVGTDDYTEDLMALEVLTKAVQPELMGTIVNKASAKEAWDALYLRNVGAERVRKARASTLRHDFDALKFKVGEMIDDFGVRINSLVAQLAVLGTTYTEEEVVRRFLQALPPRFNQIAASSETLLDLANVSLDEMIGRLKPVEEKMNRGDKESLAKLNLTKDQLVARLSSRLKVAGTGSSESSKEGSSSSGGKRGRGHRNGGRGGGDGGGRFDGGGGHGSSGGDMAGDECRYCRKKGHWARECKKKKRDEQAHAAQVDDGEESALLVACARVHAEPNVL